MRKQRKKFVKVKNISSKNWKHKYDTVTKYTKNPAKYIGENLQFFSQHEPILVGTKDYRQKAIVSPSFFFPRLLRP